MFADAAKAITESILSKVTEMVGGVQKSIGDVTAKTIARIGRGETDAPQGHTLKVVATRLGVEPNEITSY